MFNQQLIDYIRQQTQNGKSKDEIKKTLLESKWDESVIEESFVQAGSSAAGTPPAPPQEGLRAGKILSTAWTLYRARYKVLIGITLIPTILWPISILGFISLAEHFVPLVTSSGLGLSLFGALAVCILFFILLTVVQMWGSLALLYAIKDTNESIGITESYRRAWGKVLSSWWISILTGLVVMGGYILFVVPGIIFNLSLSLAVFVLVSEDTKGMSALLKSREYIRGKWWDTFGKYFFMGLVLIPAGLILWAADASKIAYAPEVANFIVSLLCTPLIIAYTYQVYLNLREQKNSLGLVVTAPSKKTKVGFTIIALLPFIFLIVSIVSFVKIAPRLMQLFLGSNPSMNSFSDSFETDSMDLTDTPIDELE